MKVDDLLPFKIGRLRRLTCLLTFLELALFLLCVFIDGPLVWERGEREGGERGLACVQNILDS